MIRYRPVILLLIFWGCNSAPTKQTKLLIGEWKVGYSSILPFEHISFCENLNLNSVSIFDQHGGVKILPSDTSKESCLPYQKFSVDSSKITFLEGDMVFYYDLLKLTSDSLIFRNPYISKYLVKRNFTSTKDDSLIKLIKQEGIIVKLIKTK